MFHPDDEALAGIALGDEAGLTAEELDHVRSCASCSATIDSLRHTLSLARGGAETSSFAAPPAGLWSRIEEVIDAQPVAEPGEAEPADTATIGTPGASPEGREAPRVSASTDAVRPIEAAPSVARERRQRGRLPLSWAAGLAAAGIAVGLLTGRAVWQDTGSQPTTVATTELDTLDTSQRLGDAALLRTGGRVDLRVATSPLDAGDGYLEVWLINSDGKRMISVGVLRGDGPETFPISQTLIDQGYVIVDISREGFDDKPEHSGDSLARGTLAT